MGWLSGISARRRMLRSRASSSVPGSDRFSRPSASEKPLAWARRSRMVILRSLRALGAEPGRGSCAPSRRARGHRPRSAASPRSPVSCLLSDAMWNGVCRRTGVPPSSVGAEALVVDGCRPRRPPRRRRPGRRARRTQRCEVVDLVDRSPVGSGAPGSNRRGSERPGARGAPRR